MFRDRKKSIYTMILVFCMIITLFIPVKAEAANDEAVIIVESLTTTSAKIIVSSSYWDSSTHETVYYNYSSVTAKIGNAKYSMSLEADDGYYRTYTIIFPAVQKMNEKVIFSAVYDGGKTLTKSAVINIQDCEIEWGDVSYIYDYSAIAFAELDDDFARITEAYEIVNGQKISAEIIKDGESFGNRYRIEFPMNYRPNTKIEACIVVNGFTYSKKYVMPNIPPVVTLEDIDSASSAVKGNVEQTCTVSVEIGGKTYSKRCEAFDDFSISVSKLDAGSRITITAKTDLGHTFTKNITVKQAKSYVGIVTPVHCADGFVFVYADNLEKGDIVQIVVSGKKYSKKVTSSGEDQYVKVKVGKMKKNTTIKASVCDSKGNIKGTDKAKVTVLKSSVKLEKSVLRSSTKVKVKVSDLQKDDKVKLQIGKRTYTQKVKRSSKNKSFSFKIKKADAGTKITITVYDKYGNKKGSKKDIVYYGTKIYVGMSTKNLKLTTWGAPDHINHYSNGPDQWVYKSGSTRVYVYVSGGKVVSIQRL